MNGVEESLGSTEADRPDGRDPPCAAITLLPASLPGAQIGASYNQTLTARRSGSTGPYTFSVPSGATPTAPLSSGGALTGTPKNPVKTYTFTVTATDTNGCQGSKSYTVVVGK